MPSRRPSPQFDAERLMKRIDERFDQALEAMLSELGTLRSRIDATQFDVRLGNQKREEMAQRLSDLEMQVIETREHLLITDRTGEKAGRAVAETAVAAAEQVAATAVSVAADVAKTSPRNVWKTKLGLITAGSAAFVAVVAFFNNLPQFVRGTSEVVVRVFNYVVSKK